MDGFFTAYVAQSDIFLTTLNYFSSKFSDYAHCDQN